MHDAAVVARQDPDRLSFIDALRVLQCQLPESPLLSVETWYHGLVREVRRQVLRPRRDRWYARVIKRKMSHWMKKRPEHRNPPQPTKPFGEAVVLLISRALPLTRISQMRSRNRHDSCARTLRIPGFPTTSCPFAERSSWVTARPSRFDLNSTAVSGSASSAPRSPAMPDCWPTANSTTPST